MKPKSPPRQRRHTGPDARVSRARPSPQVITFANRQRRTTIDTRLLRVIVRWFVRELRPSAYVDLNICLLDGAEITRLNETFLRHSGSTDVITFDYSETGALRNDAPPLQGEIFVCVDEALEQARRFRAPWQNELVRYIVHGILHLSGYDDAQRAVRRVMKRAENQWLRRIGVEFSLQRIGKVIPRGATGLELRKKTNRGRGRRSGERTADY